MVSKIGATGFAMEDVPAAIIIIFIVLAVIGSVDFDFSIGTLIVMVIIALLAIVGSIVSKFLEEWWTKILSIIAGVIGIVYFFLIVGDIAMGMELGIASSVIAGGGVLELLGGIVD